MNEYEKIALETRKKVSRLTLEQQRQMLSLYENTIDSLAINITKSRDKSLTRRWLLDYNKELKQAKRDLSKEIELKTKGAISKAAIIGTETEQQIMGKMFEYAGIDTGNHFNTMFSQVQKGVIEDIISGNLYKDKKTLSQRIWSHSDKFEKDIQYIINMGILEKKSALELARDLEQFVKDPAKRSWEWSKVYPNMTKTKVDYNAQRLARTSINHAYQTSSIQSSNMNPFVEGMEWRSAQIHGRTCDLCFERHGQIFPKDDVPLDHANGLCTMLPHIPKDLDTVADELKAWLDGGSNPMLDKWYNDHGEYFAFKKLGNSYNTKSKGIINDIADIKSVKEKAAPFQKIYEEWDGVNIKDFATKIVEHEDLPFKVNRHILKGANGQCRLNYQDSEMEVLTYEINSEDIRGIEYQIKTAFHELFHSKSNGLVHDIGKISFNDWAYVDDVFAEVTAHYLTKSVGITKEIAPSYATHLVNSLPKLKTLPEFSSCKTLADFGEVAYNYRFSNTGKAQWESIFNAINSSNDSIIDYSKKYIGYIKENKSELVDKLLENMPKFSNYKNNMVGDIDAAIESIDGGYELKGNEKMIFENALIIAMNRLGVK